MNTQAEDLKSGMSWQEYNHPPVTDEQLTAEYIKKGFENGRSNASKQITD